jgi:hypothetical protein
MLDWMTIEVRSDVNAQPFLVSGACGQSLLKADFRERLVIAKSLDELAVLEREYYEWANIANFSGSIRPIRRLASFALKNFLTLQKPYPRTEAGLLRHLHRTAFPGTVSKRPGQVWCSAGEHPVKGSPPIQDENRCA